MTLHSTGVVSLTDVFFEGNTAKFSGGGMSIIGTNATLTNCSFHSNNSGDMGGGISFYAQLSTSATVNIVNSTFAENVATLTGGAVYIGHAVGGTQTLTLINTTVAHNRTSSISNAQGGGIFIRDEQSTLYLYNTLVAKNTATTYPDIRQTNNANISGSNNLVGNNTGFVFTGTNTNNLFGIDPKLGSIQTVVRAVYYKAVYYPLLEGSPAIDKGDTGRFPNAATAKDIAGNFRVNGTIDIGAYEYSTATTDVTVQTIIRDTIAANNNLTYRESDDSRIATLNEWSRFSIDIWATSYNATGVTAFTTTFQYNATFFVVSNVVFGAGFTEIDKTSVAGRVTFSASAITPQTGRVLLGRIELKPAATPYTWTAARSIASNLGFTANTISIQSRPVSGGNVTTSTPSIAVQNLMVTPVPYDLADTKDNAVNLQDFSVFIKQFGKPREKYTGADFDGDGKVDLKDFSQFIKAFGKSRDSGLRNPLAPAPIGAQVAAAAIGEPPALVGELDAVSYLETDILETVSQEPRTLFAGIQPLTYVSGSVTNTNPAPSTAARFTVITADYRLHSGCYWVSESQIQSEEFYRRRFFEELAMESEAESTEVKDEWLTLEAVL